MFKFYSIDNFNKWHQDFCKDLNLHMSSTFINALEYYKDNNIKLNTYFPLLNYSNYSECYLFNSNIVIKMGQLNHIFSLYEKYLKNPILNNYIVPFYIYCLPMEKDFLPAHSLEIQQKKLKDSYYSANCLILQPNCTPVDKEMFDEWKIKNKDLYLNYSYLDIHQEANVGFYNNQIKFFDW